MADEVDNYLIGNTVPSLSFLVIGTTYEGRVTHKTMQQARDIKTGAPKFWEGTQDPVMQAVITLQTDEHENEDDDGLRKLYVGSMGMRTAIANAIREAGAKSLELNGVIKIRYTGDGEATKRGFNPPKEYRAKYTPPALVDDFFDDGGKPSREDDTPDLSEYSEEPF